MSMDIQIKLSNGKTLRGFIKSPGENIRAGIILVHGLGEHINRYNHWAGKFNKNGIGLFGVDLPGHGKSDGKRGNINSYSLTSEMLDLLLKEFKKTFPGIPVFLYGHSLGGGIVLSYILQNNPDIKGAIVTSPWLRLAFEPDNIKLLLAKVMKNIVPSLAQPSGLVVSHVSHDQKVVDDYNSDPLNHDKISVALFHNAVTAAQYALNHAGEFKIPLLLMHGADDLITSPQASRDFASKSKMTELKIWEGGYHELHNETFKDDVFAFELNWLNKQI
jgi:alpha-beta hydrolase superfamily lysophospholipase